MVGYLLCHKTNNRPEVKPQTLRGWNLLLRNNPLTPLPSQASAGRAQRLPPWSVVWLIGGWIGNLIGCGYNYKAVLSLEQLLSLSDSANGGTRYQWGETCSVTPPPRYSNREGCEVCQMGVSRSGAVIVPRLRSWPQQRSLLNGLFITNGSCIRVQYQVLLQVTSVVVQVDFFSFSFSFFYSIAASGTTFCTF